MGRDPGSAPSLGLDVSPVNLRNAAEIERAVTAFARVANGGLIVTGSAPAQVQRPAAAGTQIFRVSPE
jgi:hypothetical protein